MNTVLDTPSHGELAGVPTVDLPANLSRALAAGKKSTTIVADVARFRVGPGKLTPQEYFYYRLWDDQADGRAFVGKIAQGAMHVSTGTPEWFATSADKWSGPYFDRTPGATLRA